MCSAVSSAKWTPRLYCPEQPIMKAKMQTIVLCPHRQQGRSFMLAVRFSGRNNICKHSLRDNHVGTLSTRGKYDIFGIGEAIVDYSGCVSTDTLSRFGLEKGGRRVITVDERAAILEQLESKEFKLQAGGSLANTLAGVAALGEAMSRLEGLNTTRVGMAGSLGSDHMGDYFIEQLREQNVEWVGESPVGSATGTVVVLGTPDAQRSFLSLPSTGGLTMSTEICTAVASSRMIVIEGYMWQFPGAAEKIRTTMALARAAGSLIAMTAADVSIVKEHREDILQAVAACDVFFSNEDEARALTEGTVPSKCDGAKTSSTAALRQCTQLGELCPMAVVTHGSKGSCVAALGELHVIPPRWTKDAPVDTCGAGDAYAAGFLFGYLQGMTVREMGELGSSCASRVISQHCAQITKDDASSIVSSLQTTTSLSSEFAAELYLSP